MSNTMKNLKKFCLTLFVSVSLFPFVSSEAHAHGLDEGQLILRLAGDTLYVTATPNQKVFSSFDLNKDKKISKAEINKNRDKMIQHFIDGLEFRDTKDNMGKLIFKDIGKPHFHASVDGAKAPTHLRVRLRFQWKTAPAELKTKYKYALESPLHVRARRFTARRVLNQQRPLAMKRVGWVRQEIFLRVQ